MRKKKRITQISFVVVCMMLLSLLGGGTSVAEEPEPEQGPLATVTIAAGVISWEPQVENGGMVLTVAGPGDFYLRQEYEPGVQPTFKPEDGGANALANGVYKYELLLLPVKAEAPAEYDEAQRGLAPPEGSGEALVQSGSFSILDGSFVTPDIAEIAEDGKFAKLLSPDVLHYDDVIITGSLCTGFDCQNGESFGFDTIILKEHNLRIYFNDTSYTASYPTNNWRITINDSTNGGASYFSIDDVDDGTSIFKIEAGAPSNSLYVEDYGRVGLGTSTPVVELHIKDSDTPTLRLEQDGSGGWTPQTWDVAGNESNFFIRDATNGSKLPFRIQPSTPSSTLCLKADGRVGVGTWSPQGLFHVEDTDVDFIVADDGDVGIGTTSPGSLLEVYSASANYLANFKSGDAIAGIWLQDNTNLAGINNNAGVVSIIDNGGAQKLSVNVGTGNVGIGKASPTHLLDVGTSGAYCDGGAWVDGSSREYKTNIQNLTLDEAMAALKDLNPVRFNYQMDLEEEYLGFIAEDVPDLVATNDRKGLSSMDIVAVLTKVVQEQQRVMEELETQNAGLEERVAALEVLVTSLVQGQTE